MIRRRATCSRTAAAKAMKIGSACLRLFALLSLRNIPCCNGFVAVVVIRGPPSDAVAASTRTLLMGQQQLRRRKAHSRVLLYGKDGGESGDGESKPGNGASIPNLSASLVKSIVGSGVLALPASFAALGDYPNSVLPAGILVTLLVGSINAYFFALIGKVCGVTGATSYRDAWEKTVGPSTGQYVALAVVLKTALSCLAYSIILADSVRSLAVAAGFADVTRTLALEAVTLFGLLPLCLLRDLASLAPFSVLGLVGMGFTTSALVIRYLDGSYALVDGAAAAADSAATSFLSDVSLLPSFGDAAASASAGPSLEGGAVLACTLATAFVAHYNAPRFFNGR